MAEKNDWAEFVTLPLTFMPIATKGMNLWVVVILRILNYFIPTFSNPSALSKQESHLPQAIASPSLITGS